MFHLKRKLRGQTANAVRLAPLFLRLKPHVVNLAVDNHFYLPAVRQDDRLRVVPILISVGRAMQNLAVREDDGSIKLASLEGIAFLPIRVIPSINSLAGNYRVADEVAKIISKARKRRRGDKHDACNKAAKAYVLSAHTGSSSLLFRYRD